MSGNNLLNVTFATSYASKTVTAVVWYWTFAASVFLADNSALTVEDNFVSNITYSTYIMVNAVNWNWVASSNGRISLLQHSQISWSGNSLVGGGLNSVYWIWEVDLVVVIADESAILIDANSASNFDCNNIRCDSYVYLVTWLWEPRVASLVLTNNSTISMSANSISNSTADSNDVIFSVVVFLGWTCNPFTCKFTILITNGSMVAFNGNSARHLSFPTDLDCAYMTIAKWTLSNDNVSVTLDLGSQISANNNIAQDVNPVSLLIGGILELDWGTYTSFLLTEQSRLIAQGNYLSALEANVVSALMEFTIVYDGWISITNNTVLATQNPNPYNYVSQCILLLGNVTLGQSHIWIADNTINITSNLRLYYNEFYIICSFYATIFPGNNEPQVWACGNNITIASIDQSYTPSIFMTPQSLRNLTDDALCP